MYAHRFVIKAGTEENYRTLGFADTLEEAEALGKTEKTEPVRIEDLERFAVQYRVSIHWGNQTWMAKGNETLEYSEAEKTARVFLGEGETVRIDRVTERDFEEATELVALFSPDRTWLAAADPFIAELKQQVAGLPSFVADLSNPVEAVRALNLFTVFPEYETLVVVGGKTIRQFEEALKSPTVEWYREGIRQQACRKALVWERDQIAQFLCRFSHPTLQLLAIRTLIILAGQSPNGIRPTPWLESTVAGIKNNLDSAIANFGSKAKPATFKQCLLVADLVKS